MCKYCEDLRGWSRSGYREWASNGGAKIIFDPEDVGFLLKIVDNFTYNITFCPWCGRKLELPEEDPEFSAEDEIRRLEGRINHINTLLGRLVDTVGLWANKDRYNIDVRTRVVKELKDIRGKI